MKPLTVDENQPIGGEEPTDEEERAAAENWLAMPLELKAYCLDVERRAHEIVVEVAARLEAKRNAERRRASQQGAGLDAEGGARGSG